MKLLAVDTSITSCSVALLHGDHLLAEAVYAAGGTHSSRLMRMIQRILGDCGCKPGQIGGLAVTRGPGTFTGLRIGLSTVKGLAAATQVPVVGVGSLEALAVPFLFVTTPVVVVIDARRGEVYHAHYRCDSGLPRPLGPVQVGSPEALAALLPDDAILVGSGAVLYREVFQSRSARIRLADPTRHLIRASSVGVLAMERLRRQDVDGLDLLIPEYVRPSDAQIQSGPG